MIVINIPGKENRINNWIFSPGCFMLTIITFKRLIVTNYT